MAKKKTSAKKSSRSAKNVAPAKATGLAARNPGMVLVLSFILMFASNSVVLYFANAFFPNQVVLGTHSLPVLAALLISMTALTLDTTFSIPFFRSFENMRGKMLTSGEWMVGYLFINFASLWFIGRFAEYLGLGFSSWMVVLALAAVMDFFQGLVMMALGKAVS